MPTEEEIAASKRKLGMTQKAALIEQYRLPANQASPHARGNVVNATEDESDFVPIDTPDEDFDESDFEPIRPIAQEPDMAPMRQYFEENLKKVKEAKGFKDYLEAGWDMSVTGLIASGKPDVVLPENASMAAQIASGLATVAGDLPAIVPGFFAGAAAGSFAGSAVVPGPGTVVGGIVGAGAGSNALPAAVRSYLMDGYENGEFKNFSDFWSRASSIFIETAKQAAVGAAAGGAGVVAGKVVGPAAGKIVSKIAPPTAEIATMTTVGAALEGEMPSAEDFTVAAGMVAVIHGIAKVGGGTKHVSKKLRDIYAETGIKPEQVVEDSKNNPIVQQELLMDNGEIPSAYKVGPPTPEEAAAAKPSVQDPPVSMADVVNEPVPEIKPDHPAVKTILDNVQDAPKTPKEGYNLTKAYTDFVDKLTPINEAVKILAENPKELSPDQNPYQLARMANDSKAKVKHVIERGTIDFKTLEINGKSLTEIVAPFTDNLKEFEAFLISKRVMDYEKRGLHAGFDLDAAKEVIKMGEKKYGAAAKELVEFQRRNLQYIRDAGLISDKSMKAMVKAGESYIPLKRILEPEQFENVRTKGGALKKVKGVEEGRDIKTRSPLLSILENTESFMRIAEKNRAIESFVKLAEDSGEPGVIEKVKAKSRPIEVTEKELARFFEENGIEADAEAFNIFRPNTIKLAENEFEVIRDGKREVYRTTPELAEAFKKLDGDASSMNVFMRLARGFTTVKRIGITLTPDFIVRNFLRDQMTTAATSKGNVTPFVDVIVAMGDLLKKNDSYYNWLKAGGAQGAFLELNDRYLMKDVFKLEKSTGMLESTWNVIKKPVDALLAGAHIIELAPRLAEFKKVSHGEKSGPNVFKGGFASREVTLDFQRIGAKMSAWNAITAFTNATIQGADKTARALRDDPAGVALKGALYITTPSILLWWANHEDERYKAIPRWEKDLYWHIITDDWQAATPEDNADLMPEHLKRVVGNNLQINKGIVFRVPKPHEFGVLFGSLPERILEKFSAEDPRAFKGFGETIAEMIKPSVSPDVLTPMIEQKFNESLFTGRPLIPFSLEKIAPEFQFTDYTSETAKQLGKLTSFLAGPERAASPVIIDNYIRQWGGTMGQYAVQLADLGLEKAGVVPGIRPAAALSDIPAIKAFVTRYPGAGAQQITDFYDRKKQVDQKLETIRALSKKQGMAEELESYMEASNAEFMGTMKGTASALTNSRKMIQAIHANPEIPPKEKRQLIDAQYYYMIEAAGMAMKIADEMDKNLEEAKKLIGAR